MKEVINLEHLMYVAEQESMRVEKQHNLLRLVGRPGLSIVELLTPYQNLHTKLFIAFSAQLSTAITNNKKDGTK